MKKPSASSGEPLRYFNPAFFKIEFKVPGGTSFEKCRGTGIEPLIVGCRYISWAPPLLPNVQPCWLSNFINSEYFILRCVEYYAAKVTILG